MTRIDVPAREGRGVRVAAGRRFRVIDVEGGQVADTFAFRADDVSEYHSAEHTRAYVSRLFRVASLDAGGNCSTRYPSTGRPPLASVTWKPAFSKACASVAARRKWPMPKRCWT